MCTIVFSECKQVFHADFFSSKSTFKQVLISFQKTVNHNPIIIQRQRGIEIKYAAVNEALNEIYLEKQDYESLRLSIKDYDSFESVQLAMSLENHDLLDCRRIAALLYRKNKRYQKSIEISKKDQMFKDAMETVAESKDTTLAEDLLRNIIEMDDKELFAAMLYSCYALIKPDVVLELAWRKDMQEFIMPYMIQTMKDMSVKVESVQKSIQDIKKKKKKNIQEKQEQALDIGVHTMFDPTLNMGGPGPLAIT